MYARMMVERPRKRNFREEPATSVADSTKFKHKRSLGQNFLTSTVVPKWMIEASDIKPADTILEIGPGTGMLTRELLASGATIIAIEADQRAITELELNFAPEIKGGRLTIHHGDAREITPNTLGLEDHKFKVVANIPYYLSGFLLRSLLENKVQPSSITFLIQKELAVRIARDKKESLLSLSVKAFGVPTYYKTVGKGHFFPKPKVDSAIIKIDFVSRENFNEFSPVFFFEILHLGLGKKRKQLLANLSESFDRIFLQKTFSTIKLSPTVRGEDVPLQTWLHLVKILSQKNNPLNINN
jgi:16S rRNA (adenine1518-N6/adenine1519-N6)-dimethyltransferase